MDYAHTSLSEFLMENLNQMYVFGLQKATLRALATVLGALLFILSWIQMLFNFEFSVLSLWRFVTEGFSITVAWFKLVPLRLAPSMCQIKKAIRQIRSQIPSSCANLDSPWDWSIFQRSFNIVASSFSCHSRPSYWFGLGGPYFTILSAHNWKIFIGLYALLFIGCLLIIFRNYR